MSGEKLHGICEHGHRSAWVPRGPISEHRCGAQFGIWACVGTIDSLVVDPDEWERQADRIIELETALADVLDGYEHNLLHPDNPRHLPLITARRVLDREA